jgi:hypothetical protein
MICTNVVQSAGGNGGAESATSRQMVLMAGDFGAMGPRSGWVRGAPGELVGVGAVAAAADMTSAVFYAQSLENEGIAVLCHTLGHKSEVAGAARAGAGDRRDRGGRGVGAVEPDSFTIGFDHAENFHNAVPPMRCPQCLISSCFDCDEVPCGWTQKKRGGAA